MNGSKTRVSCPIAFFFWDHFDIKVIILNTLNIFYGRLTFSYSRINSWYYWFIRNRSYKTCAISTRQKSGFSFDLFFNDFNFSRWRSQLYFTGLTNRYMSISSLFIKLSGTAGALNKHEGWNMGGYLLILNLHASNNFGRPFKRILILPHPRQWSIIKSLIINQDFFKFYPALSSGCLSIISFPSI